MNQSDLDKALRNLVTAKRRIHELRNGGMSDAELQKAMLLFGFGSVTLEEFMSAQTVADIAKLLDRNTPNSN